MKIKEALLWYAGERARERRLTSMCRGVACQKEQKLPQPKSRRLWCGDRNSTRTVYFLQDNAPVDKQHLIWLIRAASVEISAEKYWSLKRKEF